MSSSDDSSGDGKVAAPFDNQQVTFSVAAAGLSKDFRRAVLELKAPMSWPVTHWAELWRQLDAHPQAEGEVWRSWGVTNPSSRRYLIGHWSTQLDDNREVRATFEKITGRTWAPSPAPPPTPENSSSERAAASASRMNFGAQLPGQQAPVLRSSPAQDFTVALSPAVQASMPPAPGPPTLENAAPPPAATSEQGVAPPQPLRSDAERIREATGWPLDEWAHLSAQLRHWPNASQAVWALRDVEEPHLQQAITQAWTSYLAANAAQRHEFDRIRTRLQARLRRLERT